MRGSPIYTEYTNTNKGIIPAHAGLTNSRCLRSQPPGDHPRACGAHLSILNILILIKGSSPRMRGSQIHDAFVVSRLGIIPAHAGLTYFFKITKRCIRDHPRACGAHPSGTSTLSAGGGSSPRMRGSRRAQLQDRERAGIIPAHAGLTVSIVLDKTTKWDHPRACGAHMAVGTAVLLAQGSSPRMRGSLLRGTAMPAALGIIPAHAGLTLLRPIKGLTQGDHPRACGAHSIASAQISALSGSSPRMRGSQEYLDILLVVVGIIPAHAGLTFSPP